MENTAANALEALPVYCYFRDHEAALRSGLISDVENSEISFWKIEYFLSQLADGSRVALEIERGEYSGLLSLDKPWFDVPEEIDSKLTLEGLDLLKALAEHPDDPPSGLQEIYDFCKQMDNSAAREDIVAFLGNVLGSRRLLRDLILRQRKRLSLDIILEDPPLLSWTNLFANDVWEHRYLHAVAECDFETALVCIQLGQNAMLRNIIYRDEALADGIAERWSAAPETPRLLLRGTLHLHTLAPRLRNRGVGLDIVSNSHDSDSFESPDELYLRDGCPARECAAGRRLLLADMLNRQLRWVATECAASEAGVRGTAKLTQRQLNKMSPILARHAERFGRIVLDLSADELEEWFAEIKRSQKSKDASPVKLSFDWLREKRPNEMN